MSEQSDAVALQALATLAPPFYIPWTSGSLTPTALMAVANDIVLNKPRTIVEVGSGLSTVYLAALMKQHGFEKQFYSLEHDQNWASMVNAWLIRSGLQSFATMLYCPLDETGWYTIFGEFEQPRLPKNIDLLLVDGPPAWKPELAHARLPALDRLAHLLSPQCTIFLDDANRVGEQEVIARWEKDYGLTFSREYDDGRLAVARRNSPNAICHWPLSAKHP
jgi:hypothetical protein